MHLKRLQLHGFKTFADKTLIDFSEGVTAVVGPNGSGKSNIADFAAQVTPHCLFEFMPVEGRVYFIRKADGGA